ncbi:hypothetical protein A2634_01240 [Candidatus Amesbacteria bacterium RIFCSPHIGHO2_01_FULL_48_32]|uniref:Glutamyl-tRNA amidotransferase n=1 Tax=Candidatus Amesbacteria bacterium RIFCSPLOWO2_01_FULL_48_25 TaxID=1797259 RepID=A0A1F4ZCL9_9BACT|nr:MAG: hypothetical protein A2634_01240 [Candidatus Amesbacteria bacterium RIFCSPHIGHO2_01_FULL_48_32]OGD03666.1 MAG: hypothetical protein A2989_03225 [Candidatus Amesbacteria bacterium RIFCSPLOWO2_01_FULL_48_25]HJZ05985.1 GatB/YqeY domain-containing protein [Patescibacteria group bacterium]
MISEKIRSDLTSAMKAGDSLRVSVLRMAISAFDYRKIELQRELTEAEGVGVLQNEAKKRREAIESYRAGGRGEQAKTEEAELAILQGYLPSMMSEEEIRTEVAKMELPKDFGGAMRLVAPVFKGKADGGLVARIVGEMVSG